MSDALKYKNMWGDTINLAQWKKYVVRENYVYAGVSIPGLQQKVYHTVVNDILISAGVFSYHGILVFVAWGPKEAVHCAYHSPLSPEGKILERVEGCPDVVPITDHAGTVVGFTLGGKKF